MYLSTVTRASGLVLGAAAAFVWRPWRSPAAATSRGGWLLDGLGMLAVAMLGCIAAVATLTDGYVYQWLLALVTLLSLVAVLVAVHPAATWFRGILSWPPLVEIGKRSYGIYLWHWPIFVFAEAYRRFGGAGRRRPRRHGRGVGAVLPVRGDAGAPRRARAVVAVGEGAAPGAGRRRGALVVASLIAFYASVDPFDRADGGEDVTFGGGDRPQPTSRRPRRPPTPLRPDGGDGLAAAGRRRRRLAGPRPGDQPARRHR